MSKAELSEIVFDRYRQIGLTSEDNVIKKLIELARGLPGYAI